MRCKRWEDPFDTGEPHTSLLTNPGHSSLTLSVWHRKRNTNFLTLWLLLRESSARLQRKGMCCMALALRVGCRVKETFQDVHGISLLKEKKMAHPSISEKKRACYQIKASLLMHVSKSQKVFINRMDVDRFPPTPHARQKNNIYRRRGFTIRRCRPGRHVFLWWLERVAWFLWTKIKVFHPLLKWWWFRNNKPAADGLNLVIFKEVVN